jgi:hypothetical protein
LPSLLHQQEEKTTMSPEHTRERAEALFKRKEETRIEGDKAMAEYEARQQALRDKDRAAPSLAPRSRGDEQKVF